MAARDGCGIKGTGRERDGERVRMCFLRMRLRRGEEEIKGNEKRVNAGAG